MPDERETHDGLARTAIAWYVRLKDPTATEADRVAFHAWLHAAPERAEAFRAAEQLWQRLEQPALALGTNGWYRPAGRRRIGRSILVAAVLLVLGVALLWWRDAGILARAFADYATPPGTHQETTLTDGTRVYLDGDSAITVTIAPSQRTVRLLRGRVWFEVQAAHPAGFRVLSGSVETRVLGTAFAVERVGASTTVTVERGDVAIHSEGGALELTLAARQRVRLSAPGPATPETIEPDLVLAWRRGLCIFDRAPLGLVIAELARMTPGRVLVTDAALRQRTISGVFRTQDPDAVLNALRRALGVKTTTLPGIVTIIHP